MSDYQNHIQNFYDETENRYNYLIKTYLKIKNNIYNILDQENILNLQGQIDKFQWRLLKHHYIERNFWPILDTVNRENISNIINIIDKLLSKINNDSNNDWFLNDLKAIFNDYFDIRDESYFDKNCDSKMFQTYLYHIIHDENSDLQLAIREICIDNNFSEIQYKKVISKIQKYINENYIPAINHKYAQIRYDRSSIRNSMMKVQEKLDKYQKSMKYIYN